MRYLGIDYGKKRVGIALSDEGGQFALPKVVLPNDHQLVKKIKEICDENKVSTIVVGESKNYKGEENAIMKDIRSFVEDLKGLTRLPVLLEPEFLTSAEAERINQQRRSSPREKGSGPRAKRGENEMLDASAAALILKSFLDKQIKL